MIPTSGTKSISLWDVADATQLIQWMVDHLGEGISHEVHEVNVERSVMWCQVNPML